MAWNDESWRLCSYSLEASPTQAPGLTPKRLRGSLIRLIRPIGRRNADGFAGRSRGSKTSHRPGRRSRERSRTRPRQSLETTLPRSTHASVIFTAMPGTSARRHLRQPGPTSRGASKHARQTRIGRPKSALTHAIIVKGEISGVDDGIRTRNDWNHKASVRSVDSHPRPTTGQRHQCRNPRSPSHCGSQDLLHGNEPCPRSWRRTG